MLPGPAGARVRIEHQEVDAALGQMVGGGKPGLPCADHDCRVHNQGNPAHFKVIPEAIFATLEGVTGVRWVTTRELIVRAARLGLHAIRLNRAPTEGYA
ncbi:hypothetical protein GCM10017709_05270 [Glutamicibacter nicotianae]|uniref:Uncharacterized protein n=1 Tax=Glutamicibacter nicotianae TaxID=37929 RepID=A0ABQ0RMQ9_GLUNI|nr:hypothetical protein ANI01nite_22810 [Glutamicibacter nicotianae]